MKNIILSYTSSTYTYLPWNNPNLTADKLEVQFLKNIQTIGDYAFYKNSRINDLEFSRRGSYAALQRELGKEADEPWSEEDRRHFATVCYYFKKAYAACGGGKLQSTFGDALLSYLQVYGYPALGSAGVEEIK